jgi:hypothetical protein
MKTNTFFRLSGMILLAAAVSLAVLMLVYAIQHPDLMVTLASIGWNR